MAYDALVSLLLLMVLAFIFYGPWQWVCTDYVRQRLFELRDEVFDIALDGGLSFNSREYIIIRKSIESNIRFAHELTFPRFIFICLFCFRKSLTNKEPDSQVDLAINRIKDGELSDKLRNIILKVRIFLVLMIVARSTVLIFLSIGFLIWAGTLYIVGGAVGGTERFANKYGKYIQIEADGI